MNFIRNRNFRAGPQTSLEGFICPQNSDKQQKNKVFGRSVGGQVLDLYNQQVYQGIAPTMLTTIDSSSMTFVTIMSKEIIHTAPNGKKYSIQIRKYTPRDCFRLMGVHEADIDKLLSKEKTGQLIISKSKLYALAGNSIVTNCLTAMFEELIFPSGNHYHDKTGQLSLF